MKIISVILSLTFFCSLLPMQKIAEQAVKQDLIQSKLIAAANGGHLNKAKKAIAQGANPNKQNKKGRRPLDYAVEGGHEDVVKYLLDQGADPYLMDNEGRTASYWAKGDMVDKLKKLIAEKFPQPQKSAKAASKQVVKPLVVNKKKLFFEAAKKGDLDKVKDLLSSNVLIDAQDDLGRTALSFAAESGRNTVLKELLEKGASVDLADKNGETPLLWATKNNHTGEVSLLLRYQADPTKRNINDISSLDLAITSGPAPIISTIINAKPNFESANNDGNTPLLLAAKLGNEKIVEKLIQAGANTAVTNGSGKNVLQIARENGRDAVVKLLESLAPQLFKLPEPVVADANFESIWQAIGNEDLNTIAWYLHFGLIPDAHLQGKTLLTEAAKMGKIKSVQMLVDKGATLDQPDSEGYSALAWAARSGHKDIVKLLALKGADINHRSKDWGMTPLMSAVMGGYVEIAELLTDYGADVNAQDHQRKRTPLMWVIRMTVGSMKKSAPQIPVETSLRLIELLLSHGADKSIVDAEGKTPLQRAKAHGHPRIAALLSKEEATEALGTCPA